MIATACEEIHNVGMPRRWLVRWLVMTAFLTFVGVAFSVSVYITSLAGDRPLTWASALGSQLLHFVIWAAMCPSFIWLGERVRFSKREWKRLVFFHLLAGIFFSLVQILVLGLLWWALTGFSVDSQSAIFELYQSTWLARVILGIAIYAIIATMNYALDYYDKYRLERHRTAMLEAHLAHAQLSALKMQLQPHFLFNTLNSISSMVLEDPRAAIQMIARLGDFLRVTIENHGMREVTLKEELDFLQCYLEIQQERFRDRLKITLDVEPGLLNSKVPNLIMQPLVENAITHGIARRAAGGRIRIGAKQTSSRLSLQVINDGPQTTTSRRRDGVGLANTRERLRCLYGDEWRLDLEFPSEGGAICTIELPVTHNGH